MTDQLTTETDKQIAIYGGLLVSGLGFAPITDLPGPIQLADNKDPIELAETASLNHFHDRNGSFTIVQLTDAYVAENDLAEAMALICSRVNASLGTSYTLENPLPLFLQFSSTKHSSAGAMVLVTLKNDLVALALNIFHDIESVPDIDAIEFWPYVMNYLGPKFDPWKSLPENFTYSQLAAEMRKNIVEGTFFTGGLTPIPSGVNRSTVYISLGTKLSRKILASFYNQRR